jgi:hypothetical protein
VSSFVANAAAALAAAETSTRAVMQPRGMSRFAGAVSIADDFRCQSGLC